MSSYWEHYNQTVAKKLSEIDLFIKTHKSLWRREEVAKLLDITPDEVARIMSEIDVHKLDRCTFFQVMQRGSSPICRMFRRELERGLPKKYSPYDVSYIYDIDIDVVLAACERMGATVFDAITLQLLFYSIPA